MSTCRAGSSASRRSLSTATTARSASRCPTPRPSRRYGGRACRDHRSRHVDPKPVRKRLPKARPSLTRSFTVAGAEGYLTAGSYPDDGLGEVFLKLGKQGSTLAGVMDAFSMAISISLQYGVPLETYVSKFTNMQFEPAGLTDDPDIRMSKSIIDYIFRRLALDHLPFEKRAALGIYSAEERQRQLDTGSYEAVEEVSQAEALKSEPSSSSPVELHHRWLSLSKPSLLHRWLSLSKPRRPRPTPSPRPPSPPQPAPTPPPNSWRPSPAARSTARSASPAAPRCARPAAATSAKAAAPLPAAAESGRDPSS